MSNSPKHILFGLYDDDDILIDAIKVAKKDHLEYYDVYTPFPVHGIDEVLELSESRLHRAGFVYGMLGTLTALGGMTWIFTKDWPLIIGGKPYFALPSFIPITFELTVLFACIGMVVTFYTICGLGPGVQNPILDNRITDDKFCIAFETNNLSQEELERIKSFLSSTGASEIHTKTI